MWHGLSTRVCLLVIVLRPPGPPLVSSKAVCPCPVVESGPGPNSGTFNILSEKGWLQSILTTQNHVVLERIESILRETDESAQFTKLIEDHAEKDKTWKQFVFVDCMAYVSLYLGIRSSNWNLRMSALKQMAPLFSVYDRPCYSKIIPHHFAEYQLFPWVVQKCLGSGGFTVSICGESGRSVAFDEAHEMLVNKDMKAALVMNIRCLYSEDCPLP